MLFNQASLKNSEAIDEVLTIFCHLSRQLARKNLEFFSQKTPLKRLEKQYVVL